MTKEAQILNISSPQLPRCRRAPLRLDDGSQQHRYQSPKGYYRHQYFETLDLFLRELEDRFNQTDFLAPVLDLESLLMNASNGKYFDAEFDVVKKSCYCSDCDFDALYKQLPLLGDMIRQALPEVKLVTSVRTVCDAMNSQAVYKSLFSEVHKLLRLYLTPITSATAERTFSDLRRSDTYLRTTMTQKRLNNCLLLHIHNDACDMQVIANEFFCNDERRKYFGTYCISLNRPRAG